MGQFLLPDLGEGLEEAQLVQWMVRPGDAVQLNAPLCQVETAKALVDIPSPYSGTVSALHVAPGDTVPVGAPLLTIIESSGGGSAAAETVQDEGRGPVLVGYGTEGPAQSFVRRRRAGAGGAPPQASAVTAAAQTPAEAPSDGADGAGRASPLVRKVAAERGIDLRGIAGTGPGGRIRMEDLDGVSAAASAAPTGQAQPVPAQATPDEERISTVGLRKAIAARMVKSATTIPQFVEYTQFDASALVARRERLKAEPAFAEVKLTFLPLLVAALVAAVRRYPIMNARWDEDGNAIVVKHTINVGIATDTARGLLVPVIANAQALDLAALAREAQRLVVRARDGQLSAQALTGGTITLTNVGAAGPVDTGAPLINPPEACVVGFGAIKPRATVVGDHLEVRPGCWISMSCDHRIVDGATAAQFMGALVEALEDDGER
ncbi:MAG: dihydrolipoamide acetyltransferase family protein [Ktedonobacterales bacterium]